MTSSWQCLFLLFSILFIIYHLISVKLRWILLLISRLVFLFIISGLFGFIYTFIFILISYFGAYYVDKNYNEKNKIIVLVTTIVTLFLGLLIFKFTNIVIPLNNFIIKIFNIPNNIVNNVIVPIGISYYVLILIAYVIDVYRKVTTFEKNFFKYLLFSIYFPQILMGPIVRHNDTKEQLFSQKPIEFSCIQFGILRILWGIIKKIVIADRIAILVNTIFSNYTTYPSIYIILGIALFGIQFYIDFSSAMDIVLGISECLGIKLPENFRNPFFSISFHQYWQRWHITIFTFYRDYIFYPIVRSNLIMNLKTFLGTKSKWSANHIPIFIAYISVWIFAGIWHGGGTKAMFGNCLLPCIYLISTDIVHDYTKKLYKKYKSLQNNLIYRIFQIIFTYILLCSTWVFFVAKDIKDGFNIIYNCFSRFGINFSVKIIYVGDFYIILIGIILIFILDIIRENKIDIRNIYINKIPFIFHWLIISVFIIIIMLFGLYGPYYNPQDFVYFNI